MNSHAPDRNPTELAQADGTRLAPENIVLFGPPGVGKSTIGRILASRLGRPFADVDELIESQAERSIQNIFNEEGEQGFRQREAEICRLLSAQTNHIIAVGGGALLDHQNRAALEASASIILLTADQGELVERLRTTQNRPLLGADLEVELASLLDRRQQAYQSFPLQVDTNGQGPEQVVEEILNLLEALPTRFRMTLNNPEPGYELVLGAGLLSECDRHLSDAKLQPPFIVISDANVAPLYAEILQNTLKAGLIQLPAGEANKNLATLEHVYHSLAEAGMERSGTIIALGGGVVGDLAGLAAATYMRGLRWVNVPTSTLAMVDASIGGKVAVDLPQGKNLIGAFHQPSLVLADVDTLETLPVVEYRSGLVEAIKAAVIGDELLFRWFEQGARTPSVRWFERAISVKLEIVQQDPFERDIRAKLNLGHTVGHGLETASGYKLRHGEAIGIGMLIEARIAEELALAEPGLTDRIADALAQWQLPTHFSGIPVEAIRQAMNADKKKANEDLRFALPSRIGHVDLVGDVPEAVILQAIDERLEG